MNIIGEISTEERATPIISVVVPLYNKQDQVASTIDSILKQSFENFEILIVDDGSNDDSSKIVKQILDPRIRLIQRENGGDGAARNTGIREAKGEIIAFIDADDEWMSGFLNEIIILRQKFPDAGMFATGYRVKYHGNYSVDIFVDSGRKFESYVLIKDYFGLAIQRGFITSSNVAIVRSAFNEVGTFYEMVGASCDRDMWARVAMKYDVVCSSNVLAIYNCEPSLGRVSRTKRKNPPPPAISHTVKKMIESDCVTQIEQNLIDYVNIQWFDRVDKSIHGGNINEARRILVDEIVKTEKIFFRYRWYRFLTWSVPLPLIQIILKFQKSRWVQPFFRFSHGKSYPRVVQKVKRLALI